MCLLTFDVESCGKTVCKQILDNAHTDRLYSYVYIDDDEELLLQNMHYTERNAIFRRLLHGQHKTPNVLHWLWLEYFYFYFHLIDFLLLVGNSHAIQHI